MAAARRLRIKRPVVTLSDVFFFLKVNLRQSDVNIATNLIKQFQAKFKNITTTELHLQ